MKTRTELIISLQNEVDLCFEAKKTRDNDGPPYTWTWAPIIVSGFLLFKELCVLSQTHFLYLLKLVCFILSWGGFFALARLKLWGPSQCLNFGPTILDKSPWHTWIK